MQLKTVDAAAEQSWNHVQLHSAVDRPKIVFWTCRNPAVVLGGAQKSSPDMCQRSRQSGIDLLKRRAGGGAVLVGPWMLSMSLVVPPGHPLASMGLHASYEWLGGVHAAALQSIGIASQVLRSDDIARREPDNALSWACYGGFSVGEIVVDGRKLVGLAQLRSKRGVLFVSGAHLYSPDWGVLCEVFGRPSDAGKLEKRNTSCEGELGRRVTAQELYQNLQYEFSRSIQTMI